MQAVFDAIERIPVATITHVLLTAVLGLYLLIHGDLPPDALVFAGIAEGGNVGVAGARAHVKAAKAKQPKQTTVLPTGNYYFDAPKPATVTSAAVDFAPDEPGDPDSLPHISTDDLSRVPADQGDAGTEGSA